MPLILLELWNKHLKNYKMKYDAVKILFSSLVSEAFVIAIMILPPALIF